MNKAELQAVEDMIDQRLIPDHITNNHPGEDFDGLPSAICIHQTGNTAKLADASAHAAYLYNGSGGRSASWHITISDTELIQSMPWTSKAWAAGDWATGGPSGGNHTAIHCELTVQEGYDEQATLHNAARWCAWMQQTKKVSTNTINMHNFYSGKDCPHQIRSRAGAWQEFLDLVDEYRTGKSAAPWVPSTPVFEAPAITHTARIAAPTPPPRVQAHLPESLDQSGVLAPMRHKRNFSKAASDATITGGTAGIVSIVAAIIPEGLPTEAIIGALVGAPVLLTMLRRYARDLLAAYKEMKNILAG